ncbi:hypothetical protein D3C71_2015540 [compost metagenome]
MVIADRAEAAIQAAQAQATHLPVMNTAGDQTEQDTGVQHPCNQRAVVTGDVHGR